jgi:aromatic ring-cleaving dioxygenase
MTSVTGYQAHVYFAPATGPIAERLRQTVASKFAVEPGGLSDEPRGSHPISQFNIIFCTDQFQAVCRG